MNRLTEPRTETAAQPAIDYPAQIEDVALGILGYNDQIRRVRDKMQVLEDGFTVAIMRQTDTHGKAYFSNDVQRGIELRARLAVSEEYQGLKQALEGYEDMKAVAVAKLERLRGEFKLELADKWQDFGRLVSIEEMTVSVPVLP
jgi:hypothetical protein